MKVTKKLIRGLMALCMAAQLIVPAFAANERPIYLALGDSISTGYGLIDPSTESFVNQVAKSAKYSEYELVNKAVNGNTAEDIYDQLTNPNNSNYVAEDVLASADLITITCGGNDIMNAMYGVLLQEYNNSDTDPSNDIDESELPAIMDGTSDISIQQLASKAIAAGVLNDQMIDRQECQDAIQTFRNNLNAVITEIRTKNSTASIIVTTQYNPYKVFEGKRYYGEIYKAVTPGLDPTNKKSLNYAIINNPASSEYAIADVYTTFEPNSAALCNAKWNSVFSVNVDFHPNADGHTVIANTILALEHTYTSKTTPPTCTEQGYTTHTCSDCGHSYKDNYVDAVGHSYTSIVTDKELKNVCSACDDTTDVVVLDGQKLRIVLYEQPDDLLIYGARYESNRMKDIKIAEQLEITFDEELQSGAVIHLFFLHQTSLTPWAKPISVTVP